MSNQQTEQKKPNRVWIELELPDATLGTEACKELGDQRAKAASNMIRRLTGKDVGEGRDFVHYNHNKRWYGWGEVSFLTGVGYWFNLDYLGREGE